MSLEKDLVHYKNLEKHSFHFPGHKGKWEVLYKNLAALDTTETFGTDNLAQAEGILKESMEKIAKIYGAHKSFFGLGGSTMGIYAGLYALSQRGQRVGVQRNAHRSVFQACELLDLEVCLLDVDRSPQGLAKSLSLDSLERAQDLDILVVTSPSYYGYLAPMKEIMDLARKRGIRVLVDEAHGGHFPFFKPEASALAHGADMVVHSVHKMLPGLTSTALVHAGPNLDQKKLQRGLNLFTTTSPSYPMMVSIEKSVTWMDLYGRQRLQDLLGPLEDFRKKLEDQGINLVQAPDKDPFKLLIEVPGYGGLELYESLFYDHGLGMEMHDQRFVLAVVTAFDDPEDLDLLAEALASFEKRQPLGKTWPQDPPLREERLTINRRKEGARTLYYKETLGLESLDFITPYPPGIPLIFPGERIREDQLRQIEAYLDQGIQLEGLDQDHRMDVIE